MKPPGDTCRCGHLRFNHSGEDPEGGRCLITGCTCDGFQDRATAAEEGDR